MEVIPLKEIQKKIAEISSGQKVQLIAVSKNQSLDQIKSLYEDGQRLFAENYVQEARQKIEQLKDLDIEWHFIGHLQTNKVKNVIGYFHLIHSVDSIKLLEAIQKTAEKKNIVQKILLQVNFSQESTKEGFEASQLLPLVSKLNQYPNVQVLGLMTMPPLAENPEDNRIYFQQAKKLLDQTGWPHLSMGTSHDYIVAIEEGATLVRLGTILFGVRKKY